MGEMTFFQIAKSVLVKASQPLTAAEIWDGACAMGIAQEKGSKGKTPAATLSAQLYTATKKTDCEIARVGEDPVRFMLREALDHVDDAGESGDDGAATAHAATLHELHEKDLHDLLVAVAADKLNLHCFRINETVSSKGPNQRSLKWEHPDFVGCYFPFEHGPKKPGVREDVWKTRQAIGAAQVTVVGIELKLELSRRDMRPYFFQTLSNSYWANQAYLAVGRNLLQPEDIEDLRAMCKAFGVGIIELDLDAPERSRVFIQAERRDEIQWQRVLKLADANPDFRQFLKTVTKDAASDSVASKEYARVLEYDEVFKELKRKLK
jgi:hypothetical protein